MILFPLLTWFLDHEFYLSQPSAGFQFSSTKEISLKVESEIHPFNTTHWDKPGTNVGGALIEAEVLSHPGLTGG